MNRAVIVIALWALWIAGCTGGSATPAPAGAQAGAVRPATAHAAPADASVGHLAGKPLYLALCAPCHGADGKGYVADRAPSLVNPTFLESATDKFLRQSIALGRPGTSMAAYSKSRSGPLDDAAIERLVSYLREQGPPAKPLPAREGGDVATGEAVYAKRCLSCHGDARTRGEAPSLANPAFLSMATDAFMRHAVVHGRPGTKMEAFAGTLSDAEIDGVVSFVRKLSSGVTPVELLPAATGTEPLVLNPRGATPKFTLRGETCPPGREAGCNADPRFVSVEQVARAVAAKQRIVIIDARTPSEWRRVHIAGAVSIPYHDLKRLDEIPRDGTWIVAYCGCPHHLSGIVVDALRLHGYAHSAVLDEGINDWHRRGFPVVAAPGVTAPPAEPPLPAGTIR